jgi:glycerophosphoryl diester phosphodiesterase
MRTGQPIRPVVIAHRGASGYLPEHTLPAKALAFEMGADYLEQDVVATLDDELVVLHDIHLDRVTNVANRYSGRCREDGRYYVRDFSLEEIRALEVHERTKADGSAVYPGRLRPQLEVSRVQTFTEELAFIAELQANSDRSVGIYPEIKSPAWHRNEGIDIAPQFLRELQEFGYESYDDPVYVQCFDDQELIRIREFHSCEMKLIQLIGDNAWRETDTDYAQLQSTSGLERLAKTVDGIGPWVNQLYRERADGGVEDSGLVSRAHATGLAVHPYTFRADDLPPGFSSFGELLRFFVDELSIDGLFTDFPDLVRNRKH